MRKFISGLSVVLLFLFNLTASADKIAAVVNNEIITEKELNDYLKLLELRSEGETDPVSELRQFTAEEKKYGLERLIEDKLIVQEAKKLGAEIVPEVVEKQLNLFISQFPSKEEFEVSLIERGLNIDSLRKKISEQILMRQMMDYKVKSQVEVAPYEVTEFYGQNKDKFTEPQSIKYKGLKFSLKSVAYQAYDELKQAEKTEDVLNSYSENRTSGILFKNKAREELDRLFECSENEIIAPVIIDQEYYIFIVEAKNPPRISTLEEVKENIQNSILQAKIDRKFRQWLNELKEKAVIKRLINKE